MQKTQIAIVEDNVIIRDNVMRFITLEKDFESAGIFGSVEALMHTAGLDASYKPDILLLDIGLPGMSGLDGLPVIRGRFPDLDIIILTTYEESDKIIKALSSGACSYISKKSSLQEIVEGIRVVLAGGAFLSPSVARGIGSHFGGTRTGKASVITERQREILRLLIDGKSYDSISQALSISVETVRTHIKKMYRLLEVSNKTEAIAKYNRGEV